MMGRHHATSGLLAMAAAASAAIALGLPLGDPRAAVVVVLVAARHFLRPDIDHHRSIETRALGPLSRLEHEFWCSVAAAYYLATRAEGDSPKPRVHRGFTHTPVGAVVFGAQSAALVAAQGPCAWLYGVLWPLADGRWWAPPVIALGFCGRYPVLGVAFLGSCALVLSAAYAWSHRFGWGLVGVALGLSFLAPGLGSSLGSLWWAVGLAAAFGSYGHDLGDGCTTEGCPLLHPRTELIPTKKGLAPSRWVDHGTPELLRFPTGSRREQLLISVLFVVAGLSVAAATGFRLAGLA